MQQFGFLVLLPDMKLKTFTAFHSKCIVGINEDLVLRKI